MKVLFLMNGFLFIFSQCDVNTPRRPGPHGEGDEEARDGQGPLHLAACWGQEKVIQALLEHNANVNQQVSVIGRVGFCV